MTNGRRDFLQASSVVGLASLVAPRDLLAQEAAARATRGMPVPRIKDIIVFEAEPGRRIEFVKVVTDQDGLYGWGDATAGFRDELVRPAVEKYLKPLLVGQPVDRIEDIWHQCYYNSYYKNDSVLNVAISGVDSALWDIKGRQAGMPVYQLIGGKLREAAEIYMHAGAADPSALIDSAKKLVAQGVRNIHVDFGQGANVQTLAGQQGFDREAAIRHMLKTFETFRTQMPEEIGLGCDVHSRINAKQAVQFCKDSEQFKLYFMEDVLSPEDSDWYRQIRQVCITPIAIGEMFTNPHEWQPLISERLIDYIRCHVSKTGGFTQGRKIAILAEQFGVKTAWHGSMDMSPLMHMAHLHLALTSHNFGIHEYQAYNDPIREMFQNILEIKGGYAWANDKPGWGIEVDEKAVTKFPFGALPSDKIIPNASKPVTRLADGTVVLG